MNAVETVAREMLKIHRAALADLLAGATLDQSEIAVFMVDPRNPEATVLAGRASERGIHMRLDEPNVQIFMVRRSQAAALIGGYYEADLAKRISDCKVYGYPVVVFPYMQGFALLNTGDSSKAGSA